jgi:hypothetical protein
MLTLVGHLKHVTHRVRSYFEMRLAYAVSMFNVLAQWYGLQADAGGVIHLSIAEFSLWADQHQRLFKVDSRHQSTV